MSKTSIPPAVTISPEGSTARHENCEQMRKAELMKQFIKNRLINLITTHNITKHVLDTDIMNMSDMVQRATWDMDLQTNYEEERRLNICNNRLIRDETEAATLDNLTNFEREVWQRSHCRPSGKKLYLHGSGGSQRLEIPVSLEVESSDSSIEWRGEANLAVWSENNRDDGSWMLTDAW